MSASPSPCPLCGSPLYGWLTLPDPSALPTVGRPVDETSPGRVIERCEACGVGVEAAGAPVDLEAEAAGFTQPLQGGGAALVAPNRASWQASVGGEGWAAIDRRPGRLLLSPDSLRLLGERTGRSIEEVRFAPMGRNQASMWQTLLNGLTFHPNFARDVHAGTMRPATARNRFAFFADCVATVLAAPLVALASVPLELAAVVARRGGEMVAPIRSR